MNTSGTYRQETTTTTPSIKGGLTFSVVFHLIIFTFVAFGLPHVVRNDEVIEATIPIEMVDIAEVTQTDTVSKPTPKPPEETPDPPKQQKPAPPKMTSEAPPDLTTPDEPKPEEPEEELPEPELPPPPEENLMEVVPKQKPKPPATKVAKPQPQQDFQSLLKNLTPDAPEETQEAEEEGDKPSNAQVARLSDRISMSELDAVRRQLGRCWNILAGAKYAEDLVVEIRVTINRDRTVQSATILDQSRYNRDANFRAAADAAMRALRNPLCNPLQLPPEKYDLWRVTIINFDPREIL